jgi:hypothetical protein
MAHVDFNLLRRRIAEASRQTFDAVRAAHKNETFYVFALYAVDDAVGINPSMNSEQAYQRAAAKQTADEKYRKWLNSHGISFTASLLGDQRWSAYDWAYECAESDGFAAVNALINNRGMGFYDEDDPTGFVKFKAGVFASMVLALRDLTEQGHFGKGGSRDSLTVFCSVPHSACTLWFEQDSARRLNPPKAFQTFASERIKWLADGSQRRDAIPDDVQALYLSMVEKG